MEEAIKARSTVKEKEKKRHVNISTLIGKNRKAILMGALPPTANPRESFFSVRKINRSFFIYFCFILFIIIKNRLTVVNITIRIVHIA